MRVPLDLRAPAQPEIKITNSFSFSGSEVFQRN
jgi:hypothetical protein